MDILSTPNQYLYELQTTSPAEAKRLWRRDVKKKWNNECAYCGDRDNLTIDHVVPRCKGGTDFTKNVVCCCSDCNQRKGHEPWEEWFLKQKYFSEEKYQKIREWMEPDPPKDLFKYRPRRNNAS